MANTFKTNAISLSSGGIVRSLGVLLACIAGLLPAPDARALTEAQCQLDGKCVPRVRSKVTYGHFRTLYDNNYPCEIHTASGPFTSEADFVSRQLQFIQQQYDEQPACSCAGGVAPVVEVVPSENEFGEWATLDGGERLCTAAGEMCPQIFADTNMETYNNKRFQVRYSCGSTTSVKMSQTLKRRTTLTCPEGSTATTLDSGESACWVGELPALGQCSGDRSPPPSGTESALNGWLGNPTHTRSGNKVQTETDYAGAGPAPLRLVRSYNSSDATRAGGLGAQWRHSYERDIQAAANGATVTRGDGALWRFHLAADGSYGAGPGVRASLARLPSSHGELPDGFALTLASGRTERYDLGGRLRHIEQRGGLRTTLAYDGKSQVTSVTGPFGHQLTFSYQWGRLVRLTDPAGHHIFYRYDNDVLSEVEYPHPEADGADPAPIRRFHYEDPLHPQHITGITDERGVRVRSYVYDLQGRVALSEGADIGHGIGVGRHQFDYGDGAMTTVTTPRGGSQQRWFDVVNGHAVVARARLDDDRRATSASHDEEARRARITDPLGGVTATEHPDGQIRIHTQATGAALERQTVTQYLSESLELPLTVTTPSVAAGQSATTSISYNASAQPQSVIRSGYQPDGSPVARSTGLTYYTPADGVTHTVGLLESTDGPREDVTDVTTMTYHDCNSGGRCGRLASVTDAMGHQSTYSTYDAHGRVTTMTAPSGVVTTYDYDRRGRLRTLTESAPGEPAQITRLDYDAAGGLRRIETPGGVITDIESNAAGDIGRIVDALGRAQQFSYDTGGQVDGIELEDADGTVTSSVSHRYDSRDRRVSTSVGGASSQWRYDALGRLTHATDANGNQTRHHYDALGRLTRSVDPDHGETRYGYDANDQLIAVTDPESRTTAYAIDDLGNTLSETSPARGVVTYTHDTAGNLQTRTDARGITVSYQYDALNRLVLIDYPSDDDVVLEYDGGPGGADPSERGQLTRITRGANSIEYSYDRFGNITGDTRAIAGQTFATGYGYDPDGRLERITYPSGTVVWYRHDAAGQVSTMELDTGSGPQPFLDGITYRPFGPMASAMAGNGLALVRDYDERGLPANISVNSTTPGSAPLVDRDYATDPAGNISAIDDFVDSGASEDFTDGYDPLDRLVAANGPYGPRSYQYDGVGNRKRMTYEGAVAEFSPKPALSELTFEYNEGGRIARALSAGLPVGEYRYNALEQRERKVAGGSATLFVYGLSGELLMETDEVSGVAREYLYLNGRLVGVVDLAASVAAYWVHTDHLGTPRAMTEVGGGVIWATDQAPFGRAAPITEIVSLNVRFPGQYLDAETGMHYNHHRYYDAHSGRYSRPDPIGLESSLNLYSYVDSNALFWSDPHGLSKIRAAVRIGRSALRSLGIVSKAEAKRLLNRGGDVVTSNKQAKKLQKEKGKSKPIRERHGEGHIHWHKGDRSGGHSFVEPGGPKSIGVDPTDLTPLLLCRQGLLSCRFCEMWFGIDGLCPDLDPFNCPDA